MTYTILETPDYEQWFAKLHDPIAKKAVVARLHRLEVYGHFGDSKAVGAGVSELRIHTKGGIRVYYTERHGMIVVLLAGGDKSSQTRDIAKAQALAAELED